VTRTIATVLVALAAGCGDECAGLSTDPCDIRSADCQDETYRTMACLRHAAPGAPPPVRLIAPEQYADELRQSYAASPPDPHGLAQGRLLGFDPSTSDAMSIDERIQTRVDETAAFYSPTTKMVTIIDRPMAPTSSGWSEKEVLGHELVHAQQDRELDLGCSWPGREATTRPWRSGPSSRARRSSTSR
jgi:hypothetical protein